MKTLTLHGVTLGEGTPKIAVSITGQTEAEILQQARTLGALGADIAEWRMDHFAQLHETSLFLHCLSALRETLGEMPLLATFRTKGEGGAQEISAEDYLALNLRAIHSGLIDLVDAELLMGDAMVQTLVRSAHEAGVLILLSNHDFSKTPPVEEMVRRLRKMQSLGGDLLKIAVMPRTRADVLSLLEASCAVSDDPAAPPVITMSMGDLGVLTRLCGAFSGSVLTFGAAEQASAPGQIPARELRQLLAALPLK